MKDKNLRDQFEGFGDKFFSDIEKAHAMFLEMREHPDGFSPAIAFLFMSITECYLHGFALVVKEDHPEDEPMPPGAESITEMMSTVSQIAEVLFENREFWSNDDELVECEDVMDGGTIDIDMSEYENYTVH